jgi:hypothetical protein
MTYFGKTLCGKEGVCALKHAGQCCALLGEADGKAVRHGTDHQATGAALITERARQKNERGRRAARMLEWTSVWRFGGGVPVQHKKDSQRSSSANSSLFAQTKIDIEESRDFSGGRATA